MRKSNTALMNLSELEIHMLTKEALKGDIEALKIIVEFLTRFNIQSFKVVAYLIVYQTIMNLDPELGNDCEKCGGICCKSGSEIQLYSFDLKDLMNIGDRDIIKVIKCNSSHCYLSRPCVFQAEWKCSIHRYKPYACLSYPFASGDVQYSVISNSQRIPPLPVIPEICMAAKKVWAKIYSKIEEFKLKYKRTPEPLELFKLMQITT
ncbi:MAG: YkgJ family cysteine cluster protein [Ignisphaera sp.]